MGFDMKLLILTITLLFVQFSEQAALERSDEETVTEYDYNDTDVGTDEYVYPYYWCKCSFDEYEEMYGITWNTDYGEDHAWCPCFEYHYYEGYEYGYELEFPSQAGERSLDSKSRHKKKHH